MPAELSNLESSDPKARIFWPRSGGEEISKAKFNNNKIANKCTAESKGNATAKKACICAPTTHAGSFRCHLHRTNNAPAPPPPAPPPKSSSSSRCLVDDNGRKSQPQDKYNPPKMTIDKPVTKA